MSPFGRQLRNIQMDAIFHWKLIVVLLRSAQRHTSSQFYIMFDVFLCEILFTNLFKQLSPLRGDDMSGV